MGGIRSPAKHLSSAAEPLVVFERTIAINFPVRMRTYPKDNSERVLHLGLSNLVRNAPDFTAHVQLATRPAHLDFDATVASTGKGFQERYKLTKPIEWQRLPGSPARAVSLPVPLVMPRDPKKGTTLVQWALAEVDAGRFVLINFTVAAVVGRGPSRLCLRGGKNHLLGHSPSETLSGDGQCPL